jgi:hypothetical protein
LSEKEVSEAERQLKVEATNKRISEKIGSCEDEETKMFLQELLWLRLRCERLNVAMDTCDKMELAYKEAIRKERVWRERMIFWLGAMLCATLVNILSALW